MARDSRKGISLELRRVSKALIAEANSAKKRIKKVTPASKELGQPLSAVKQFTVKRPCDVVKRFLRCCFPLSFLFFFSFLLFSFLSFFLVRFSRLSSSSSSSLGTENRKKGSTVLPCREPISRSLFQLSGSSANCILRFILPRTNRFYFYLFPISIFSLIFFLFFFLSLERYIYCSSRDTLRCPLFLFFRNF